MASAIGAAWRRRPGYLDTATYGLPPRQTVELSHRVIEDWADGTALWRDWNDAADEARHVFAGLVGVAPPCEPPQTRGGDLTAARPLIPLCSTPVRARARLTGA